MINCGASQFLSDSLCGALLPPGATALELRTQTHQEVNLQSRYLIVPSSERGCVVLDQPQRVDSS